MADAFSEASDRSEDDSQDVMTPAELIAKLEQVRNDLNLLIYRGI